MNHLNPRKTVRKACSAAVAIIALSAPACPAAAATNFVVMLCDDLGYGDLGCYGHPAIRTPHLDQLAAEGIRLTNCYAGAPVCSPSRAAMLTSRIPQRMGIIDWIPAGSPMCVGRDELTIATLLKRVGYATCFSGKWHCNGMFNSPKQPQPGDHGFDHWFATQNNAGPSHRNPVNFVRNGTRVGPLTGYSSTLIVDEAITWLRGRDASRPFCVFVCFHTPHEPIATAEEFVKRYADYTPQEKAIYYGNVAQMDHEVGRLMQTLDELKLRDDTLVFFTSDNGPETLNRYKGAERSYGSPDGLRGMKLHMYEGGIRVPGILRWPGHAQPERTCSEPVANLDVLPTLCAISGAPLPRDRAIDGTSFLPIFSGQPIRRETPLFWWYTRAISAPKLAVRVGPWKLLADEALQHVELYNLQRDPAESDNLAGSEPARRNEMLVSLRQVWDSVRKDAARFPAATQPAGAGYQK